MSKCAARVTSRSDRGHSGWRRCHAARAAQDKPACRAPPPPCRQQRQRRRLRGGGPEAGVAFHHDHVTHRSRPPVGAGVEALCARVLYMTALRSTELTSSTSTIRELQGVGDQIGEARTALQQCVARAERLERRIDALAMPSTPTAALDGGTPPLSTTPRHS